MEKNAVRNFKMMSLPGFVIWWVRQTWITNRKVKYFHRDKIGKVLKYIYIWLPHSIQKFRDQGSNPMPQQWQYQIFSPQSHQGTPWRHWNFNSHTISTKLNSGNVSSARPQFCALWNGHGGDANLSRIIVLYKHSHIIQYKTHFL